MYTVAHQEGVSPPGSPDCEDNDGFALSLPVFLLQADQAKEVATILTTSEVKTSQSPSI